MPKFFAPKSMCLFARLPFGYAFLTRYHWPRDFVVNALTAWVPGLILVSLLGQLSLGPAFISYMLGYAAFISIYETGYLVNDTYGLRHDPTPRPRINLSLTTSFLATFVAIRLCVFLAAIWALGVLTSGAYWGVALALVATLIAHNCLRSVELKFYTFLQLSLLRFTLPVLPALLVRSDVKSVMLTFSVALFLFSLPRFLTYLDAKGRLNLPERKARSYHLKAHLVVIPAIALTCVLTSDPAPMICLAWALLVQTIYVLGDGFPAMRKAHPRAQ